MHDSVLDNIDFGDEDDEYYDEEDDQNQNEEEIEPVDFNKIGIQIEQNELEQSFKHPSNELRKAIKSNHK